MELSLLLTTFGVLLLVGLGLDGLGRLTRLPRITLLVLFGLAAGPSGLDWLPIDTEGWHNIVAQIALTMIAFLLGGELSKSALKSNGWAILVVLSCVTAGSLFIVGGGLWALGMPLSVALLLAGIGLATDPAATQDVVRETGADGPVTKTILGVVAVDDAWGVIVFSVLLGLVTATSAGWAHGLLDGATDVLGAVAVGLVIGLPAAFATGRIRPGEPTLVEGLGIVLLCAGISQYFDVSFLLSGMTAGVVVVNLARHHDYPFHEVEHISWPFLIVFFVLAGASVDLETVWEAGFLGGAFVVLRLLGRLVGGWIGGRIAGESRLVGLALTPQAGVALGMALVAAEAAPDIGNTLLTVTIATTIFFELVGPILTRQVLRHVGEVGVVGAQKKNRRHDRP